MMMIIIIIIVMIIMMMIKMIKMITIIIKDINNNDTLTVVGLVSWQLCT